MRHKLLIAELLLLAATCLSVLRAEEAAVARVEASDSAYQRGDFAQARDEYRAAVDSGLDGARVLYDLGNAYYRTGEIGRAIACYQQAGRQAPRDEDVRANLARALVRRKAGAPPPPPTWLHMMGRRLVGAFTLTEFAVTAALIYWLGMATAAALLLASEKRGRLRRLLVVLAVLFVLVSAAGVARWWTYHHVRTGVVAQERAELRSGPGESFETLQRLHEGSFVRVLRSDGQWVQVVAEGKVSGWLPGTSVARTWH